MLLGILNKKQYNFYIENKMEDMKMTLGEKIKILRVSNNLSQEQLAEKLNVSREAITKWENDGGK